MRKISISRAAHLLVFIDQLRQSGAPVESDLARSRLPSSIEDNPDDFIGVQFALDFVARCARDAPVAELAYQATQRAGLGVLHRGLQQRLRQAVGGMAKFRAFVEHAGRESTAFVAGLARQSSAIRVICDLAAFRGHPAAIYSEWLIQRLMLSIGHSIAGPNWMPLEMTFVSPDAARESVGDCRLISGQAHTSMLIPIGQLFAPWPGGVDGIGEESHLPRSAEQGGDDFVSTLRMAIRPYLADGLPDIGLAAEIAGSSRRTLQRELARHGLTYSEVVRQARFDIACRLLGDPGLKIIDVAFETGYANPQHFSRAFRQLSGMSPRAYRNANSAGSGGARVA